MSDFVRATFPFAEWRELEEKKIKNEFFERKRCFPLKKSFPQQFLRPVANVIKLITAVSYDFPQ